MLKFTKEKHAPYQAALIYDIVLDIEAYPSFVPWCEKAQIITRTDNQIMADLYFHYGLVNESYRSEVKFGIKDDQYFVQAIGIPGPFKHLLNSWRIIKNNSGCKIEFLLEVELKNIFLQTMLKNFYSSVAEKMVTAFELRAEELSKGQYKEA